MENVDLRAGMHTCTVGIRSVFVTVPFFSGVTVFVAVCHRLQPLRFTVQRELVSAELEGTIASYEASPSLLIVY